MPDALETLRQVNDRLRSALNRLRPEQKPCSAIKPQDFSGILSEVRQATECMRHLPQSSETATEEAAIEREKLEYRINLESLKHFLPGLHVRLLAEKSRLEKERTHLAAAIAWDRARNKTS
ncbi:MAG: hypothetical protein WAM89_12990 [Terriglobales bacterium]